MMLSVPPLAFSAFRKLPAAIEQGQRACQAVGCKHARAMISSFISRGYPLQLTASSGVPQSGQAAGQAAHACTCQLKWCQRMFGTLGPMHVQCTTRALPMMKFLGLNAYYDLQEES